MHNFRPQRGGAARPRRTRTFRAVNPESSTARPTASAPRGRTATSRPTTTSSRPPPGSPSLADGADRRAALPADHRRRQDQLHGRAAGGARRALPPRAHRAKGRPSRCRCSRAMVACVMVEHLYGETFVPPLDSAGYKRILNRWRRPFPTKDGYLAVLPYTDGHWETSSSWPAAPTSLTTRASRRSSTRLANIEVLYEELGKIVATRTTAEWLDALDARQHAGHGRQHARDAPGGSAPRGDGLLEDRRAPDGGHAAHARHPDDLQQDAGRDPPPAAAARRAQRRGAARGRASARARSTRCWPPAPPAPVDRRAPCHRVRLSARGSECERGRRAASPSGPPSPRTWPPRRRAWDSSGTARRRARPLRRRSSRATPPSMRRP